MASQIIALPPALLRLLKQHRGETALSPSGVHLSTNARRGEERDPSLYVTAHCDTYDIRPRGLSREWTLVLALVPEGTVPCCWPRPLPDDVTLCLFDALAAVFAECEEFSGHDRMALAEALAKAREAPAIGPRPISPLPPRTPRQRRLRTDGLALCRLLETELAAIDHELARYRARLAVSNAESILVALSCHAELAAHLLLRPRGGRQYPVADLVAGGSRWGNLQNTLASAVAATEATEYALERFDPHAPYYEPAVGLDDLAELNAHVLGGPQLRRQGPQWRMYRNQPLGDGSLPAVDDLVPAAAVPGAVHQLLEDADPAHWLGVHPLVHAAIVHLELVRIHPFVRANGRTARLLVQVLLQRRGFPILPWEWAVARLYGDYRGAARESLLKSNHLPLAEALTKVCSLAVRLGNRLTEGITPIRSTLTAALEEEGFSQAVALHNAEGLLGGVLVPSLRACSVFARGDAITTCLVDRGVLDAVRTPKGILYSAPAIRKVLEA